MTVEGSLDMFQLPEILQVVEQQQKTGILTVQGEQDIIAVSFLKGGVVGADSLNQTGDEGLAAVLQKSGRCSAEQLTHLQREGERIGRSLQEMLVERDVLSQKQLLDALRGHYMELLGHLLVWREGDFKFYGNDEVSYEEGLSPISVQDILLRHLSEKDGQGGVFGDPATLRPKRKPKPISAASSPQTPRGETSQTGAFPEIPDLLSDSFPSLGIPAESAAGSSGQTPGASASSTAGGGPETPAEFPLTPALPLEQTPEDEPKDLRVVYRRLPSSRPIKVRSTGGGAPDEGFIVLTLVEQRILQQIDGERSLGQVSRALAVRPEEAIGAVARLERFRLVRSVGAVGDGPVGMDLPEAQIEGAPAEGSADAAFSALDLSPADLEGTFSWVSRGLGLLAVVFLFWAAATGPQGVLLPFPWQEQQKSALEKQQRTAAFLKIDRAVKTFVLMMGRFPNALTEITDVHLLGTKDLREPSGLPLVYEASDLQYSVTATRHGEPVPELRSAEAITGNFLLDYDFFSISQGAAEQPVVLLD